MNQQQMTIRECATIIAPQGCLRAAINLGNAVLAQRNRETGELGGVSVALAKELATRLDVDIDLRVYDAAGKVFDDADKGIWDIAFLGQVPERAGALVFTEPYVFVEASAVVRNDAPFKSVDELDAPGLTLIGVKGSAYDPHLLRTIRKATLIRESSPAAMLERFAASRADAGAGVRQVLEDFVRDHAGYRVLPDAFVKVEQAMALPQAHATALGFVSGFLREMKANGLVRRVLDETGQSGAQVPS